MTYVIVLIVILVIIALIILLYSPGKEAESKIDRNKRGLGETGGEQLVAAEEEELELSFEATEDKPGTDRRSEYAAMQAGDAVEEELDLSFEEIEKISAAGDGLLQADMEKEKAGQPAGSGQGEGAGIEEEEIPFILEEERLPGKTGDDIVPALDGVVDESVRVADETPEALEERLDLFFGVDEEAPLEADEISGIEELPARGYPESGGGLTLKGYEAELRELENNLRRELNAAIENRETLKQVLLERKLTAVCDRLSDMQSSLRQRKKLLADIEDMLAELQGSLPGFQVESLRSHLREGDVEVVRALLKEAVSQLDDTSRLGARIRHLNGCLAENQADYASAFALYHHAAVVDAENPRCLYDAGRMARILGNEEDARILLEKLLDTGDGPRDGVLEALAQHELAKIHAGADEKEKAEHLLHTSLAGMEAHMGADHPELAPLLHDLAALYESSGRYEEAEPLYRRALEVTENRPGENRPDLASTYYRLAGLYEEMELEEKSAPLYEKALEIKVGVLGQEHPDVGTILNHLANLLRRQGRYEQAEPMFIRSLEILEKALGRDHPNLAVVLNNLAELYGAMGKEEKAGQYQERAFALFQLPGAGDDFVEMEKDYDIDMNDEKDRTIAGS
jgi:tetratricopeptide (TPR) repeat protein